MTTRYFFVDPVHAGSSALQMEAKLLHLLREDIGECVLSDAAVDQYVSDLKEAQENFSHENPRLRFVEIKADIYPVRTYQGLPSFIRIGSIAVPLRPVRKIL